jgi:DNA-damage-inducible protein D
MYNITSNNSDFEKIKHLESNIEFWYARELMILLEYNKWVNFQSIINKAIESLRSVYPQVDHHFTKVSKKIKIGTGSDKEAYREIVDYKLTRHACYLIAQNGDPRKKTVALAQTYFASQTRNHELLKEHKKNIERIVARKKLSETEKKFGGVLNQIGLKGAEVGEIKSAGDEALFGEPTQDLKEKLGIHQTKPLADFLPTISIKAKDLAMEMTTFNTQKKHLGNKTTIKTEHISNNSSVRKMLNENGIYPEKLPVEEDVKKLEKELQDTQMGHNNNNSLSSIQKIEIDIRNVSDKNELMRIKDLISNNQGNAKLIIYYGDFKTPQTLIRDIQINAEVISQLKKYMI